MRRDQERLRDILDAIEQIERYAAQGRTAFDNDELLQTWMVHHILIIGEAASRLSPAFRARYAEIPWRQIIAMRNLLVHAYFAVDIAEVWAVIERDLPTLKWQVLALLHAAPSSAIFAQYRPSRTLSHPRPSKRWSTGACPWTPRRRSHPWSSRRRSFRGRRLSARSVELTP